MSQEYIQGLSSNIGELERKDKEHSNLAMTAANKIVEQLQVVYDRVDGVLYFKTRVLDPFTQIKGPQD